MKLEAQKAYLAREILTTTDERMINDMRLFLNSYHATQFPEKDTSKRKIGILDGKSNIQFSDDFEMTTEELLNLQ
jgi:hypothetical protein